MNFQEKARLRLIPALSRLFPGFFKQTPCFDLAEAVRESLREWKLAKDQFNDVEPDLIDYMVYRLNAAERHYMALLSLAKTQGIKAWPDNLAEAVRGERDRRQETEDRRQEKKHFNIGLTL